MLKAALLAAENLALLWLYRKYVRSKYMIPVVPVGMFESRTDEELNRGIEPSDDGLHHYDNPFYWEWWYFDADFDDGHKVVLELQYPNLANLFRKECAMLFNVYTPGGAEYNNIVPFPENRWSATGDTCDVAIGDNVVSGEYPLYRVKFTHEGLACDLEFENLLPGWTKGTGEIRFGPAQKNQVFGWVVAQPRAAVSGTLTVDGVEHGVKGIGYHDHNWGSGLLNRYVSHWIWGRLTTDRFTMIFADISLTRLCGGFRIPLVFLAKDDRIVLETPYVNYRVGDYRLDQRGTQAYPARVEFDFAEKNVSGRFRFEAGEELEIVDGMENLGIPRSVSDRLNKLLPNLVYYRLLSDYEGEIALGDEIFPLKGQTHYEYMILRLKHGEIPEPGPPLHV